MKKSEQNRDSEEVLFEQSSGNVFADLGLENANDLLFKADLAHAINNQIRLRKLTQVQAAELAGLTQPEISRIARMKTDGFSQERMQNALRGLGIDVEIRLHPREGGGIGTLRVLELA
jgi:predicted XRE-type DNA-binding protein